MKAAAFAYHRPGDLDEACALLAGDDNARIIAGGQSLVPMMAMRLVRPTRLVDIARIATLSYVRADGDSVAIGAATRQCLLERDPLVRTQVPLLACALPWVGHAATRARGTIGGSIAHADPAAEIVLVAVTLGASLRYRCKGRDTELPASRFFLGLMTTALPAGACLTEVRFPRWQENRVGIGFHEINARRSDFAFAAAAAQVALDPDGACRRLALGIGAITDTPLRLDSVAQACVGQRLDADMLKARVTDALNAIEPMSDLHASAAYRRRAAITLAVRAVMDAVAQARSAPA